MLFIYFLTKYSQTLLNLFSIHGMIRILISIPNWGRGHCNVVSETKEINDFAKFVKNSNYDTVSSIVMTDPDILVYLLLLPYKTDITSNN